MLLVGISNTWNSGIQTTIVEIMKKRPDSSLLLIHRILSPYRFGASPSFFYTWVLWWFIESSVTGFSRFGRVCNTPLFHIEDQLFMTLW